MKDILLVDDENVFLLSLVEGLQSMQAGISTIVLANNGKTAIEMLRTARFDVVVTDLCMPVLDGFALLEYMKRWLPRVPVIVMTAGDEAAVSQRLRDLDVSICTEKPLNFKDIAGKILAA